MRPRPPLSPRAALLGAALLAACGAPPAPGSGPSPGNGSAGVRLEDVRAGLYALAADSMEGRFTGSPGMWRAARYIARRLREFWIEPAGEDGYFQRLPIAVSTREGRPRMRVLGAWADTLGVPPAERAVGLNVVGVVRGSDPALAEQAVLIDAHYDHLGIGRAVDGDSVYNGADDDATGVVTVLEVARAMARGPRPKRTVVFLLTTGEEVGLLGTYWYIAHPVFPLERTAANLEIEIIGRPDPLVGGPGRAWLTGYERSTMGDALAAAGVPIRADPRPDMQFFLRSDNIAFAYRGIPAHTLSTYNMHSDYHTPDDEPDRIDYAHVTAVIGAAVRAARLLADGPAPVWKPGGRPQPPARQ